MKAMKIPIYLVDDEEAVLNSLKEVVEKVMPLAEITSMTNSFKVWELIEAEVRPSIIISDIYMPGISGFDLLEKVRAKENHTDFYFVMITSSLDPEINIKALKSGADDFLKKPFTLDEMIVKLRAASRFIQMIHQEEDFAKKIAKLDDIILQDKVNILEILETFHEYLMADASDKIESINKMAVWIARQLSTSQEEIYYIENAAKFCFLGRCFLPEKFRHNPIYKDGVIANKIMEQVPEFARKMMSKVTGYENEMLILYHIYENFDGSGIPKRKKLWEIPLGSRILRVAIDFEDKMSKGSAKEAKVMEKLFFESQKLYDYHVLAYLDQYLANIQTKPIRGRPGPERRVFKRDLVPGMIISRNILTESGMHLVSAGTKLDFDLIEKMRDIIQDDKVIGDLYIKNPDSL